MISGGDRHFTPELTAVHDVSQRPGVAGVVETIVIVGAPGSEPPPFRVGLSVGIFYIDVAHADELA